MGVWSRRWIASHRSGTGVGERADAVDRLEALFAPQTRHLRLRKDLAAPLGAQGHQLLLGYLRLLSHSSTTTGDRVLHPLGEVIGLQSGDLYEAAPTIADQPHATSPRSVQLRRHMARHSDYRAPAALHEIAHILEVQAHAVDIDARRFDTWILGSMVFCGEGHRITLSHTETINLRLQV